MGQLSTATQLPDYLSCPSCVKEGDRGILPLLHLKRSANFPLYFEVQVSSMTNDTFELLSKDADFCSKPNLTDTGMSVKPTLEPGEVLGDVS
jgi:hypothetical protein